MDAKIKKEKRERRHKRIRAAIKGTAAKPRLSVFRSNRHMFLQLIDDEKGRSLAQVSDCGKNWNKEKGVKAEKAFSLGKKLAELAKKKMIKKAVFDRGGYKFHGRVKAVADGAREGGLEF